MNVDDDQGQDAESPSERVGCILDYAGPRAAEQRLERQLAVLTPRTPTAGERNRCHSVSRAGQGTDD